MHFSLTTDQQALHETVVRLCAAFGDDYWLARDRDGRFPDEFRSALARDGWLGICVPERFGGAGLGITEAAIMMQAIAQSGACMAGASSVHMNIFGLNPVVVFGTEAQRQRMLPPLVQGRERACFAVTEPDAGLDTLRITTRAERRGDRYVVNGRKIWISTAQVAEKMLLLARTAAAGGDGRRTSGLSLFYTTIDRSRVEVRAIDKMGRAAVDSNLVFFDDFEIPEDDRIGEEGRGFDYILHGLNPERILIAAEAIGIGYAAVDRATRYANEREVFGRKIGQNQSIQHPLAERWMQLEAARLATFQAAWRYDCRMSCGAEANMAKFLAADAGLRACQQAVLTHGGMGYARDFHVERYLREAMIPLLTPVSPQLILCFIAEKVLGLPRSY